MACINSNRHWTHSCYCFHESSFMSLGDVNKASVISSIVLCLVATVFIILNKKSQILHSSLAYTQVNTGTTRHSRNTLPWKQKTEKGSGCSSSALKGEDQKENREAASEFLKDAGKSKMQRAVGPIRKALLGCRGPSHPGTLHSLVGRTNLFSERMKPRMH